MERVTGEFSRLEAINSGSFAELDETTVSLIERVCALKHIRDLHMETHWRLRHTLPKIRERFAKSGVKVHVKTGVETFDSHFREQVLHKGIDETEPAKIAEGFDECCLLFGLAGQTRESMERDIRTGLKYFDRVCVNIMVPNSTEIKPDVDCVRTFVQEIYPVWCGNPRVDILLGNTDFGVGGTVK